MIDLDVIQAVCMCLDSDRNTVVGAAVEFLHRTLQRSEMEVFDKVRQKIEESGGIDKIKSRQNHIDENVAAASKALINQFFSDSTTTDEPMN